MSKPKRDNGLMATGSAVLLMGMVALGGVYGAVAVVLALIACFGTLMVLIALEVTA